MNLRTLDDEPRQPRPIRANIKQQAPGANVRLLGLGCALEGSKAANVLWEAVQEDIQAIREERGRGIVAAIRRAIGEMA